MGLECVVNVSEGRDVDVIDRLAAACGQSLLDVHSDPDHHRTVLTLGGPDEMVESASRMLAAAAVSAIDFEGHTGRHPAFGAVDVVPFVPLAPAGSSPTTERGRLAATPTLEAAAAARDRFARWAGSELSLPCFLYGPLRPEGHRTLPEVRRAAFGDIPPDTGPARPRPKSGGCAVGARHFLVAYNLWLADADLALARSIAAEVRGPAVRALGLELGGRSQVSCNLVDPLTVGPAEVHDRVARLAEAAGGSVDRCELVGLVPAAVLEGVPRDRWDELDLRAEATVEARLEARGVSWR